MEKKSCNCSCDVNTNRQKPWLPDLICLLLVYLKLNGQLDLSWWWIAFSSVIVIVVQNSTSAVGMFAMGVLYWFSRLFIKIDRNKGDK